MILKPPLLLDLDFFQTNDVVSSKTYDKQDEFNFEIRIFPFLDGDVPCSPAYGVYISLLIRFEGVCSKIVSKYVSDFNNRNQYLTAKLLNQGYQYLSISIYCLSFSRT